MPRHFAAEIRLIFKQFMTQLKLFTIAIDKLRDFNPV